MEVIPIPPSSQPHFGEVEKSSYKTGENIKNIGTKLYILLQLVHIYLRNKKL